LSKLSHLEKQWLSLWQRLQAKGDGHKVFLEIVRCYSEPCRAYHTLQHIQDCLDELSKCRRIPNNPDAVEMALWFHDAVYDPQAQDNAKHAEQSTALFCQIADEASLDTAFSQTVVKLILATRDHREVTYYPDSRFIIDIDLVSLGQPEKRFKENEKKIRREYQDFDDTSFTAGRIAFLEALLNRSPIYIVGLFRIQYEKQARENIAWAIENLRKG